MTTAFKLDPAVFYNATKTSYVSNEHYCCTTHPSPEDIIAFHRVFSSLPEEPAGHELIIGVERTIAPILNYDFTGASDFIHGVPPKTQDSKQSDSFSLILFVYKRHGSSFLPAGFLKTQVGIYHYMNNQRLTIDIHAKIDMVYALPEHRGNNLHHFFGEAYVDAVWTTVFDSIGEYYQLNRSKVPATHFTLSAEIGSKGGAQTIDAILSSLDKTVKAQGHCLGNTFPWNVKSVMNNASY